MPFGHWGSFDDCVSDMMEKYDEETAKSICGAMQRDMGGSAQRILKQATPDQIKQLTDNKKVMSFEDNGGRLYLNIFLLDGSVNQNDWGVTPQSIPKNIYSAIGKPVVLYKNTGAEPDASIRTVGEFDHPPVAAFNKEGDISHALAYQDLFRIGTYIDVYESKNNKGQWYGVAEITDEDAKKAIREDPKLPLFVSPTVRLMHPFQADQALEDWEFMHSAVVDRPAYGIKKAFINGQCSGDAHACLLNLKRASISKNGGKYGCGFCTYKALKQIQSNTAKQFSSHAYSKQHKPLESMSTVEQSSTTNTTRGVAGELDPQQQQQTKVSTESSSTTVQNNSPTESQQQETTKKVMRKISTEPAKERQDEEQDERDRQNENNSEDDTARESRRARSLKELSAKIEDLAAQKKTLEIELENERNAKSAMKTLLEKQTQEIGKYNDRIATLEKKDQEREYQAKLSQIQNLVYNSPVYKELTREAKDKQVETWANSGLAVDKIYEIVEPMNASLKKASLSRGGVPQSRVSLGGANRYTVNGAVDFQHEKPQPEVQQQQQQQPSQTKQASVVSKQHNNDNNDDLGAFSLVTQMFPGRA